MSPLVTAFVVLNAVLLGSLVMGAIWIAQVVKQLCRATAKVEAARVHCESLTKTIGEAHNSLAKEVLALKDKASASEMVKAQTKVFKQP